MVRLDQIFHTYLQFVIVVFPGHTRLTIFIIPIIILNKKKGYLLRVELGPSVRPSRFL